MEDKIYKYLKKNKGKEIYQCDLKDIFDSNQGAISKYLTRLERDGKIKREYALIPFVEENFLYGASFKKLKKTKKVIVI